MLKNLQQMHLKLTNEYNYKILKEYIYSGIERVPQV